MDIKKTLKEYGAKVKENPTLLLIPAGVLGGLYLLFKPAEMVEPPLAKESSGQPIGGGGAGGGMSAGTDATLSQIVSTMEAQNSAFSEAFNDLANQFASYQTNTNKQLQQVSTTQATFTQQMAIDEDKILSSLPTIYFDDKNDGEQYFNLTKNVSRERDSGNISSSLSDKILDKVAGVGNNGVGYDPKKTAEFESKMNADSSLKDAELDRANRVLENRKEAGLDTSLQEKYIKSLLK